MIESPQLMEFCAAKISQGLSVDNYVEIIAAAAYLNMGELKKKVLEMIASNFSAVLPHLKKVEDKDLLNEILLEVNTILWERVTVKN
jgi:hypothetical protein